MVVSRRAAESRREHVQILRDAGAEIDVLDARDLGEILRRLAVRNVLSLLVEGGPALQAAFLDAGLVDRIQWIRTPIRLTSGIKAFPFLPAGDERCAASREVVLGDDILTECDVHGVD
jgi:diaminohydroxyphosphoribosylaminopyrimidine deaminase/5-amino-6-(5-phosphoribosylamino)uracil reductase